MQNLTDEQAIQEARNRMSQNSGQPQQPQQPVQQPMQQPQGNPLAQFAQGQQQAPQPSGMARFTNPEAMSAGMQAMDTGKPDATTLILKSMAKYLDKAQDAELAQAGVPQGA